MKIVFNSSPLIFLSRLNFLDLFLTTESQFLLPESVQEEISAKQDQSSTYINTLIAENKLLGLRVGDYRVLFELEEQTIIVYFYR